MDSGTPSFLRAWTRGDEQAGYALYKRHTAAVIRLFRNKVDDMGLETWAQGVKAQLSGPERDESA